MGGGGGERESRLVGVMKWHRAWDSYLVPEGFPVARQGSRGEGAARDAAHHHGKALSARLVALGGEDLAQCAA